VLHLRTLATNATRKLNVLGHDGDALGVNGAQVGVLKQAHQIGLRRLLQRRNGAGLETQVGLEVLRNLAPSAETAACESAAQSTFGNDESRATPQCRGESGAVS